MSLHYGPPDPRLDTFYDIDQVAQQRARYDADALRRALAGKPITSSEAIRLCLWILKRVET